MGFANGFGWPHLLIIAAVIILLFGAKRLPEMARSLGKSARILKAETKGLRDDEAGETQPEPATPHSTEVERLRERLAAAEARATVAEQHLPKAQAAHPTAPVEQAQASQNNIG